MSPVYGCGIVEAGTIQLWFVAILFAVTAIVFALQLLTLACLAVDGVRAKTIAVTAKRIATNQSWMVPASTIPHP